LKLLGGAALLLMACAAAFHFGYSQSPQANGGLTVEARYLDFGSAWEGSRVTWKIPIKNTGSKTLQIADLKPTCNCTSVRPRAFTLEPGQAQEIELELVLDNWRKLPGNGNQKLFEARLIPQFENAKNREPGWTIFGEVKDLITNNLPATLHFGDDLIVGQPFSPLKISSFFAVPVESLEVEIDRNYAQAKVTGGPTKYEIEIVPNAALPVGLTRFELELKPHRKSENLPPKKLQVHAVIHQRIEPLPDKLTFGALPIGQSATQAVVLKSRKGEAFKIGSWQVKNNQFSVEPLEAVADVFNQRWEFKVSAKIAASGNQTSYVVFQAELEDGSRIEVTCSVSYYGTSPKNN